LVKEALVKRTLSHDEPHGRANGHAHRQAHADAHPQTDADTHSKTDSDSGSHPDADADSGSNADPDSDDGTHDHLQPKSGHHFRHRDGLFHERLVHRKRTRLHRQFHRKGCQHGHRDAGAKHDFGNVYRQLGDHEQRASEHIGHRER
jgi:hypothetical protein